jgi:hypothetical protein
LTLPLEIVADDARAIAEWVDRHPDGYVVGTYADKPTTAIYAQRLRGKWLAIRQSGGIQ